MVGGKDYRLDKKRKFPRDLTGLKFGRLTVLKFHERNKSGSRWLCRCDCGNTKVIYRSNLTNGHSTSCGCYQKEVVTRHDLSKHRLYSIWIDIRKRCFDTKRDSYKNYGGRGITICNEWNSDFMSFYNWAISNGYDEKLTLDRIDNDGDYTPENCRWVTRLVQNNNTRKNVYIEFKGEKLTISQLARRYDLHPKTITYRIENGYKGDEIIAKPNAVKRKRRKLS